ncbi:rCG48101, isoform CRA_a [Rattus norvegicus]|uniref:RCG48101, isoform CRA_a n=1 Tax=Rattus norvegicus TaxID=10116 RepID=A6HZT9_RAT|nr:rCG48101, isoform CRA_a [Rattus norvegicus]
MALPWLQRLELVLFTAAFLCGALAAAALTRTQPLPSATLWQELQASWRSTAFSSSSSGSTAAASRTPREVL